MDQTKRHPVTEQPIVYRIPVMGHATARLDIEYAAERTLDLYLSPDAISPERLPAVIFVTGFADTGFETRLGCKQKEMASYGSWARLAAASGFAAITYGNDEFADSMPRSIASSRTRSRATCRSHSSITRQARIPSTCSMTARLHTGSSIESMAF